MLNNDILNLLFKLQKIDEVEGILLGGSYAIGNSDYDSDYDIYIYTNKSIPQDKRKHVFNKYFKYIEIGNSYWEEEDDGYLIDGTPVEFIYRDIESIKENLKNTIEEYKASTGYTTCLWYNILNSKIIFDKNGEMEKLKNICEVTYPKKLKENIISKNYSLLKDKMPNYYSQIEKAIKREDIVSINHRITAFLESYFDIIFAINEMPHPGEKKLLKFIKGKKLIVPDNIENDIRNLLKNSSMVNGDILNNLDSIIKNLDKIIKK